MHHVDYVIRSYYPPNKGGGMALKTWHIGISSRDMELRVYLDRMRRSEISHVVVTSSFDRNGDAHIIETLYQYDLEKKFQELHDH